MVSLAQLYPTKGRGTAAVKSYITQLENLIAAKTVETPSSIQLAHLRRVSPPSYVCSTIRAENVSRLRFRVFDGERPLPENHPLARLFAGGHDFTDMMKRSEISLCYFGYNLLYKLRDWRDIPYGLHWVNPTIFDVITDSAHGLRGWKVRGDSDRRDWQYERDIYPHDAIWQNEIDLLNDYDGLAPAEVAYIIAMTGHEIDTTELATFRNGAVPPILFQPALEQLNGVKINDNIVRKLMRALAGLRGSANAGTNFATTERWDVKELRPAFKDLALSHLDEKVWQTTSAVFRVPLSMVAAYLVTSGLSRNEETSDWAQSWLMPRGEWYASFFTEQLARDFTRSMRVELTPDSVPFITEDEAEKIETENSKAKAGTLSLYDLQVNLGQKPVDDFKGLFWYEGVGWVPSEYFKELWRYQLLIAPSATAGGIIPGDEVPFDPTQTEQAIEAQEAEARETQAEADVEQAVTEDAPADQPEGKAIEGDTLFASLEIDADEPAIADVLNLIDMPEGAAEQPTELLHLTLAFSPSVTDEQLEVITQKLSAAEVTFPPLITNSVDTFPEGPDGIPLIITVERTPELLDLQRRVVNAFISAGVELSDYSIPDDWNPHITLAYLPPGSEFEPVQVEFAVEPLALLVQRDGYDTVWSVKDEESLRRKRDARQELKNWRRAIRKRGKSAEFDIGHLPQHVVRYVLKAINAEEPVDDVTWYTEAKSRLRMKAIQATRLDFEGDVENLLERARARDLPANVIRDRMRSIVAHYVPLAFEDGLIDGGVTDGSLSEDDMASIRQKVLGATPLIRRMVDRLLDGDGITDEDIRTKPAMWFAGTLNPAYAAGLDSAGYNPMQEWIINRSKDNCPTCKKLNGQRHRRNIWRRHNLHNPPRVGQATKCKGYRCGCRLRNARGRARGRIKAALELEHEHGDACDVAVA